MKDAAKLEQLREDIESASATASTSTKIDPPTLEPSRSDLPGSEGEGTNPVGGGGVEVGVVESRRSTVFTSESARAARQVRAEKDSQRRSDAEKAASFGHLTTRQRLGMSLAKVSQDDMDAVIRQLVGDAKRGDTKAIHALARMLDQSFGHAGAEDVADARPLDEKTFLEMTPAERATYRSALVQAYEREQADKRPSDDATDPRSTDVVVSDDDVIVNA